MGRLVTRSAGFTLLELLVVLGLIALMFSFLLPAIQRMRETADRLICQNNLRQCGLAFTLFHGDHGRLPLASQNYHLMGPMTSFNWPVYLLPYVDQEPLYRAAQQAFAQGHYAWSNPPHVGVTTVIKLLACPLDSRLRSAQIDSAGYSAAYMSYLGVGGGASAYNGMLPQGRLGVMFAEVSDGLSYTLLVGERTPPDDFSAGQWYQWLTSDEVSVGAPNFSVPIEFGLVSRECRGVFRYGPGRTDNPCDRWHFWSLHPGGANFLFGDGSVRYLPYSMRPLMVALGTRAGGEAVELPD